MYTYEMYFESTLLHIMYIPSFKLLKDGVHVRTLSRWKLEYVNFLVKILNEELNKDN